MRILPSLILFGLLTTSLLPCSRLLSTCFTDRLFPPFHLFASIPMVLCSSCAVKGFLESGFLTLAPLLLLSGGSEAAGVVTSTYDYGTMTFSLVILQASLKVSQWTQRIDWWLTDRDERQKTNQQAWLSVFSANHTLDLYYYYSAKKEKKAGSCRWDSSCATLGRSGSEIITHVFFIPLNRNHYEWVVSESAVHYRKAMRGFVY